MAHEIGHIGETPPLNMEEIIALVEQGVLPAAEVGALVSQRSLLGDQFSNAIANLGGSRDIALEELTAQLAQTGRRLSDSFAARGLGNSGFRQRGTREFLEGVGRQERAIVNTFNRLADEATFSFNDRSLANTLALLQIVNSIPGIGGDTGVVSPRDLQGLLALGANLEGRGRN